MTEVAGDFEIHITLSDESMEKAAAEGAAFAQRHGLKFSHIVLDRGLCASQPMLTASTRGTLTEALAVADDWGRRVKAERLWPCRTKVEAAPWNSGVPQTDDEAAHDPAERYFEHHVKVRLPDASVRHLVALTETVTPHDARPSRNARRSFDDGSHERFVTQRCRRVGLTAARARLDSLVAALRDSGHDIVAVEQEYVVADSALHIDAGWLEPAFRSTLSDHLRSAPAGLPGFPSTYQPLRASVAVEQRAVFDPGLKQFPHAFTTGEPKFADPDVASAWRAAHRAALSHVLAVVAGSPYAQRLVLRGSVPLRSWLGDAAREPHDLDFVVLPEPTTLNRRQAAKLIAGIRSTLARHPGAGLDTSRIGVKEIWTYERASGRRLAIPFTVPGLASGHVQVDFVFNERMPVQPTWLTIEPGGTRVRVAPPELALAWKLLWLHTDMWPQGKDLYDATLLAEHIRVPAGLVRTVLQATPPFEPESVLAWRVDWENFRAEHSSVEGDAEHWQHRLALALSQSF